MQKSRVQSVYWEYGLDHGVGHLIPSGLRHSSSRRTKRCWWYLDRC